MANSIPELLPVYVSGTITPENIANIEAAIAVIYDNLPVLPLITQTTLNSMSKMGDRREKEAKATVKILKVSPNVLLAPLTPTLIDNSLNTNDKVYPIQLDIEELGSYVKTIVDVTGAQATNWAVFAKHTIDLLAKSSNNDAKMITEKLTQALKAIEQEMAAGKLSKSDKALLKEAKEAKAAEKLKNAA